MRPLCTSASASVRRSTVPTSSHSPAWRLPDTHPSIIFVDIMMPRLDGYQTCALIKNNSAFKSTPVIMLSSKDGLFDKAKGRIVGSDQYLTKPFSKEELLGAIKAHVPEFVPVEQAS